MILRFPIPSDNLDDPAFRFESATKRFKRVCEELDARDRENWQVYQMGLADVLQAEARFREVGGVVRANATDGSATEK